VIEIGEDVRTGAPRRVTEYVTRSPTSTVSSFVPSGDRTM
jgi:hypothetical protein